MKSIAKFRNGECLSTNMIKGNLKTKLNFKCNNCNKEFCASPALIALGRHFCPKCDLIPSPN